MALDAAQLVGHASQLEASAAAGFRAIANGLCALLGARLAPRLCADAVFRIVAAARHASVSCFG